MVSEGRWKEFEEFTVAGDFVDPQAPEAFERSKHKLLHEPPHREVLQLYCELIQLRKRWPCLHNGRKHVTRVEFDDAGHGLRMERSDPAGSQARLLCNFSDTRIEPEVDRVQWELALSTALEPGAPCSACLFLANPLMPNPSPERP